MVTDLRVYGDAVDLLRFHANDLGAAHIHALQRLNAARREVERSRAMPGDDVFEDHRTVAAVVDVLTRAKSHHEIYSAYGRAKAVSAHE